MIRIKYKEIASYIRQKIVNGDWFCGMRLPSQRQLVNQFNVNRVTIIKSVELLEMEGFIYTKRGSGTYVNDYLDDEFIPNKWTEMMEWSFQTRSQFIVQLINKLETDTSFIHISKGELGKELLPQQDLREAMNKVSGYIGDLSFGYHNGYGYQKLRELIAQRSREDGIDIKSENVMITSGALHAIQLLATGVLSQNTLIFSNTPSYIDSTNVFDHFHMKQIKLPYSEMNQFQNIINKSPSNKEKAIYIESTFNNPTAQSLSQNVREKMIRYSQTHQIPIIEDDIYKDIWFDTKPLKPIKALDINGKVVYISSFSKTVAPAIRIGWIIAPEKIIERLADIRMQIDYGSSILSQMVVYELLKNGSYDKHLNNIKSVLKEKRDYMIEKLEIYLFDYASWDVPRGGFFIWLKLNGNVNIKKLFSDLIKEEKILLNPGFIYGSEENNVRLSYAYESKDNINYAIQKIYQHIKKLTN